MALRREVPGRALFPSSIAHQAARRRDAGAVACRIARPGRRSFGNILPMSELSTDMAVLLVSGGELDVVGRPEPPPAIS